jgi:hypothetical protein
MKSEMAKLLLEILYAVLGIIAGFGIDAIAFSITKYITLTQFNLLLKIIFIFSIILYLVSFFNFNILDNIKFKIKSELIFIFITSAFLVVGFNAGMRSTHDYTWFTIGGTIPFSDASDYYLETINWPNESLSKINTWRPLNSVLNFLFYFLGTNTPLGFFLIRIFLLSLVIGSYWHQVMQLIGFPLSVMSWVLLIYWIAPFLSTWLTEINGLIFFVAGITSLLGAKNFNDYRSILIGLFLVSISNTLRPFNYFLPLLFSFFFLFDKQINWFYRISKTILIGVLFLFISFLIPNLMYKLIGNKNSTLNGNSGLTLLGVTRNTDWLESQNFIKRKYPNKTNFEIEQILKVEAMQTFKSHPNQTFTYLKKSLKDSYKVFFQKITELIFYLNLKGKFFIALSLLIFTLLLLLILFNFKSNFILTFTCIIGILGYFSFSPIVFNDGKWRITATLLLSISLIIPLSALSFKKLILSRSRIKQKADLKFIPIITNHSIPVLILIIFISSISYTTKTWINQNHKKNNSFTLNLAQNGIPNRWINFNTVSAQQGEVIKWLDYMIYNCGQSQFEPIKEYFTNNINCIDGIEYLNDGYYLISRKDCVLPPYPKKQDLFGWAPIFKIKYP